MNILKDEKYQAILSSAREEFILKGFKDASMRDIAKRADVGLSNIYNYFENKDAIFKEILTPAVTCIIHLFDKNHAIQVISPKKLISGEQNNEMIQDYMNLVEKYNTEFRLLLFKSQGSSLENFRDLYTDHITETVVEYSNQLKTMYPQANTNISKFFIHTCASWLVSIIGEIVTHNLTQQEIADFFKEYVTYTAAGWKELIGM
jgi:AcrR family transcriptional regulator